MAPRLKHTPGPWACVSSTPTDVLDHPSLAPARRRTERWQVVKIEKVTRYQTPLATLLVYKKDSFGRVDTTLPYMANGRLMACAPQLLNACLFALARLGGSEADRNMIKAVISQAVDINDPDKLDALVKNFALTK